MTPRIDMVSTTGIFALDGDEFEVEDNIWIVGDDNEVVVIDAAHEHEPIVEGIAGRKVTAILLTHGHNDHINAAPNLAKATGAPLYLHPDDRMLWDELYPDAAPDHELRDGDRIEVGGTTLTVLHTPGHTPGGVCFYDGAGHVFGGDTLFNGGPGATGRKYSDFGVIIDSIKAKLLTLPPETVVHPGHGDITTIGDEAPHLEEWIARGH